MLNTIVNWLIEKAVAIRKLAKQVSDNRGDRFK
jgi:hypothetical protein